MRLQHACNIRLGQTTATASDSVRVPAVVPKEVGASAPVTGPTPYKKLTLIPAQSVDEEKFVTSDLRTVTKYWDKVFLSNTASENIYKAIAAKGGTPDVDAEKETVS